VAFRAVIFDFDGLVIDSETPLFDIWCEVYQKHGAELTMDHWRYALGTHNGFDPYRELARQTGVLIPREVWMPRIRVDHWRRCEHEPLRPGLVDRLREAQALGLPTAVASSSGRDWVEPWLSRHELTPQLDAICTRDDVERVKPAPDLFLLAARRLDVPPEECLVFEDSPNGVTAAHAAGTWVVAVPSPLTRALPFPSPHLTLASLADRSLAELQRELGDRS
jgi:HAD superfamily hydrolase (TIGR01509 family)